MTAVIGWIGSVLCVSSILQKNQLRFRALNLAACVAMVTFNVANATWSMVALNVVVAAINIRQIIALRSLATTANVVAAGESSTSATVPDAGTAEVAEVAADVDVERPARELVAA